MTTRLRRPVSTRHAFALAFDLAVRRDAFQSLVVPLLLRAPWIVGLALIPSPSESDAPSRTALLWCIAGLGDAVTALTVDAMLRVRARSVFNTSAEVAPAPAIECYERGLARVPWLFVTEMARRVLIAAGFVMLFIPGLYAAFRLAFATEAVVLGDRNLASAFRHSFHLTGRRFERWIELVALSVVTVLSVLFALTAVLLVFRGIPSESWFAIGYLGAVAVWPVLQYAWTFFYLRLVEAEDRGVEVGPLYAEAMTPAPPIPVTPGAHLSLVEPVPSGPEADNGGQS
jgi:hypothetical protein